VPASETEVSDLGPAEFNPWMEWWRYKNSHYPRLYLPVHVHGRKNAIQCTKQYNNLD